jgi:hypothetical protein
VVAATVAAGADVVAAAVVALDVSALLQETNMHKAMDTKTIKNLFIFSTPFIPLSFL